MSGWIGSKPRSPPAGSRADRTRRGASQPAFLPTTRPLHGHRCRSTCTTGTSSAGRRRPHGLALMHSRLAPLRRQKEKHDDRTQADPAGQRTHYVTTTDGVTIGGTARPGTPLVFVHGMMADGDTDWQALLPHLTGRFTCYLPSYRGRGLSGDHPDLSPGRMVDDILAYVDSIGAPTGLVGWSSGAYLAVAVAAAQSDAVDAVAPLSLGCSA